VLKLGGRVEFVHARTREPYLVTVTKRPDLPRSVRAKYALIANGQDITDGFRTVFIKAAERPNDWGSSDVLRLSADFDYVGEGDVIRVSPDKDRVDVLFRRNSRHNTILLTERCNHYCLMCSQPPKDVDDSWRLAEAVALIKMLPEDTELLLFSGGEPTLYGDGFIELIRQVKSWLPRAAVLVLSNGRAFSDINFARKLAAVQHPDCMLGIPLYSDDSVRHDYVVQCEGAFDDTVKGILNLKRLGQKVEIRIVIHAQTVGRLVQTCEFIARNLLFVDHVALMGLEITGFTRPNLEALWIDPYDYKDILSAAVQVLLAYGLNTSVYNHQLCTINPDVLSVYRKSISDWKNEYVEECGSCSRRSECGGFFSSAVLYRRSNHIRPFKDGQSL
jgi:His-Xaa-Ser system radical SAM maturase HxsC